MSILNDAALQAWDAFKLKEDIEPCIDREYFVKVMLKCQRIDSDIVHHILNSADYENGYLTQLGFMKSLALISLTKQRKEATPAALALIPQASWPVPDFGDAGKLRTFCVQVQQEKDQGKMAFTYRDLCELDNIKIRFLPEKKGMPLMGHYEYEVTSNRYNTSVIRRYNDFLTLNELLLSRFPYRLIPPFPAKKLVKDDHFLAERLHALKTYLIHISRHPLVCDDEILQHFFTYSGKADKTGDYSSAARTDFRNSLDEYLTHECAAEAANYVTQDFPSQHQAAQEFFEALKSTLLRLKEASARVQVATREQALDFGRIQDSLSRLATINGVSGDLAGPSNTWGKLQAGLPRVAAEVGAVSRALDDKSVSEQEGFVDRLDQICALLQGYSNLIRRCSSVKEDHKKSQSKLSNHIKSIHTSRVQGDGAPKLTRLESRIEQERQSLDGLEKRSHFVNLCLQLETQLVHSNLEALFSCIDMMCQVETIGFQQVLEVWKRLKPQVAAIMPVSSSASPPGGPTGGRPMSPGRAVSPTAHSPRGFEE